MMSEKEEETSSGKSAQGSAAVIKGLKLLQAIPELGDDATIKGIQRHLGWPRPTLYRLLGAMEQEGFLERNPISGEYVLGRQFIYLARRSLRVSSLQERLRGALQRIGRETSETVHLGVPAGMHMTYIDKVESAETVRMASYVGMAVPMHSTSVGKAFLAFLDEDESERYLEHLDWAPVTAKTIVDVERFRQELRETRTRGYSIDDEENEVGIICFGLAVREQDGGVAGAVSISVPRYRFDDDKAAQIIDVARRELGALR
jgi:DNA-binding IclR family transcriptional regulator